MERIKTGVNGLDELVQGGIPQGSTVLVSGGAGTCKTILASSYIYHGAKDYNEPGLYVTLEENIKNISWNIENFGWDIKSLQDKNLMRMYRLHLDPEDDVKKQVDAELKTIASIVEEMGAKRLAVDSTTAFAVWMQQAGEIRSLLYRFTDALKNLNCTTMLISETKGRRTDFSAFGVEEFVADGVLALYFTPPHRSVFVRKMRGTNHSKSPHPFEITTQGLIIRAKDEIMWEAIK
ncbi:MAG: ATPase domain-containing protein [Candidatus Diapherotrites archaeon]